MIKRILKRIDVPFWNGCNMKIKTLEKSRVFRAGDGNRTHVSSLEGWCSTIELHPHKLESSKMLPYIKMYVKRH